VAAGLRRRGVDVTTTPEAGLLEATDEMQTAYAVGEGRVIFTQDEDFLAIHASGTSHPGFVYCKKESRSIGDMIRGLILLWEIYEPEELAGRVEFL
jgi:predicted nuclease of predicted toxin-antitoxin system